MGKHRRRSVRVPGWRFRRAKAFEIERRNGDRLANYEITPSGRHIVWSERNGLTFRSKDAAEDAVKMLFVGLTAARERSGIRVVPA